MGVDSNTKAEKGKEFSAGSASLSSTRRWGHSFSVLPPRITESRASTFRQSLTLCLFILLLSSTCFAETAHFKNKELACKCCGQIKVDSKLIHKLEKLRCELGNTPIIITSGYRCPKHNKKVGGVRNSQHLLGRAVDVKVNHYTPQEVGYFAKMMGFSYIKVYKSWVHLDIR